MIKKFLPHGLGGLSLALAVALTCPAQADTIYAVTDTANLIAFDTSDPGTLAFNVPIGGLDTTETICGIDFRPSTGQLFAVGSYETVYTINVQQPAIGPVTATASSVGPGPQINHENTPANKFGVDFNPVSDQIRFTSNAEDNKTFDPSTGAVTTNTLLSPPGNVVEVAYDRSYPGASQTTLLGIDSDSDELVRIGGLDGVPSPDAGTVSSIGALGVDVDENCALDFHGSVLYAILSVGALTELHTIDPATGLSDSIGQIGTNPIIVGMAVAPDLLPLPKASIKLNFAKPLSDSISVSGILNIPADFVVTGKVVTVNVGGVSKTFTLDEKGKAKTGYDSFSIGVKAKNGIVLPQVSKYKASFKKGDFAGDLDDDGLINDTVSEQPVSMLISLNLGEHLYQRAQSMIYKASAGKSGSAK